MEYSKLEGLTILDDPTAQKYELKAGPNETNIVIMEAGFDGFGTAGSGGTLIEKAWTSSKYIYNNFELL